MLFLTLPLPPPHRLRLCRAPHPDPVHRHLWCELRYPARTKRVVTCRSSRSSPQRRHLCRATSLYRPLYPSRVCFTVRVCRRRSPALPLPQRLARLCRRRPFRTRLHSEERRSLRRRRFRSSLPCRSCGRRRPAVRRRTVSACLWHRRRPQWRS